MKRLTTHNLIGFEELTRLKIFEEFETTTLTKNIDKYNTYVNRISRNDKVAWENKQFQIDNFNLISNNIQKNESLLDFGCGIGDLIKHLDDKNKLPSNYLGVDINNNFIKIAKESYPEYDFKLINNTNSINKKFDNICAIGVFTWYITKNDFVNTIKKLYDLTNKSLLITALWKKDIDVNNYNWNSNYRFYNEELINKLFPEYNIEYDILDYYTFTGTMLIKINK